MCRVAAEFPSLSLSSSCSRDARREWVRLSEPRGRKGRAHRNLQDPPRGVPKGAERAGALRPLQGVSPAACLRSAAHPHVSRRACKRRRRCAGDTPWRLPQGAGAQPPSATPPRRRPPRDLPVPRRPCFFPSPAQTMPGFPVVSGRRVTRSPLRAQSPGHLGSHPMPRRPAEHVRGSARVREPWAVGACWSAWGP